MIFIFEMDNSAWVNHIFDNVPGVEIFILYLLWIELQKQCCCLYAGVSHFIIICKRQTEHHLYFMGNSKCNKRHRKINRLPGGSSAWKNQSSIQKWFKYFDAIGHHQLSPVKNKELLCALKNHMKHKETHTTSLQKQNRYFSACIVESLTFFLFTVALNCRCKLAGSSRL